MDAAGWWSTLQNRVNQAKDFAARTVDDVKNSELGKKAGEVAGQVGDFGSKKLKEVKNTNWKQKASDWKDGAQGIYQALSNSETVKNVHSWASNLIGDEENANHEASKAISLYTPKPQTVSDLVTHHDPDQEKKKSLVSRSLKILNRGANLALDGVDGALDVTEHLFSAGKRVVHKTIAGAEKAADDVVRTANGLTGAVASSAEAVESAAQFANDYSLLSWVTTAWAVEQVAKAAFWVATTGGVVIGGGRYIGQSLPNPLAITSGI